MCTHYLRFRILLSKTAKFCVTECLYAFQWKKKKTKRIKSELQIKQFHLLLSSQHRRKKVTREKHLLCTAHTGAVEVFYCFFAGTTHYNFIHFLKYRPASLSFNSYINFGPSFLFFISCNALYHLRSFLLCNLHVLLGFLLLLFFSTSVSANQTNVFLSLCVCRRLINEIMNVRAQSFHLRKFIHWIHFVWMWMPLFFFSPPAQRIISTRTPLGPITRTHTEITDQIIWSHQKIGLNFNGCVDGFSSSLFFVHLCLCSFFLWFIIGFDSIFFFFLLKMNWKLRSAASFLCRIFRHFKSLAS